MAGALISLTGLALVWYASLLVGGRVPGFLIAMTLLTEFGIGAAIVVAIAVLLGNRLRPFRGGNHEIPDAADGTDTHVHSRFTRRFLVSGREAI